MKEENDLVVCQKIWDFAKYYSPITERYRRTANYPYGEITRTTMRSMVTLSRQIKNTKSGEEKLAMIKSLDILKDNIEVDVQFAKEFNCISAKTFSHAMMQIAEIGRLIGGWYNSVKRAVDRAR